MEASDEVCDEAEVVHSDRIVVLWAMQELVMPLLAWRYRTRALLQRETPIA